MSYMSQMPSAVAALDWTLGWRLRRALEHAGIKRERLASELGVDPGTLTRWMHDRGRPPRPIYLKQWAMRCGVSYEWLTDGTGPQGNPGTGASSLTYLVSKLRPAVAVAPQSFLRDLCGAAA